MDWGPKGEQGPDNHSLIIFIPSPFLSTPTVCQALLQALGRRASQMVSLCSLRQHFMREDASVSLENETTQPGRKEQDLRPRPGTLYPPALALTSWSGPGDFPTLPGHGGGDQEPQWQAWMVTEQALQGCMGSWGPGATSQRQLGEHAPGEAAAAGPAPA